MGRPLSAYGDRREIAGYCFFDFANSAFTTVVVSVAYNVYFAEAVVGGGARGDLLWSWASALPSLLLVLTAPALGAAADLSGRKKRFLLAFAIVNIACCAALGAVGPGRVVAGFLLFVAAAYAFEGGYVFYNAFLPRIVPPERLSRVSGMSWGLGFLGGLAALVACRPYLAGRLRGPGGGLDLEVVADYRAAFVIVALFFAIFSIPTFAFLRERDEPARDGWLVTARKSWRRTVETARGLREDTVRFRFVLASALLFAGVDVVIKFSALAIRRIFGVEGDGLVTLFLVGNVVAAPGTFLLGALGDRVGPRPTLVVLTFAWVVILVPGALAPSDVSFGWILAWACGVAVALGATQALCRALMARLVPPGREAEWFGFYLICNRMGAVAGVLAFGAIAATTGSHTVAVLALAPAFLLAGRLLYGLREEPGSET